MVPNLQVVSNDDYKSVEHRVVLKSIQEARVSIALFFNPSKCGNSDFFGPLAELVTQERPLASTLPKFNLAKVTYNLAKVTYIYRKQLGHARPSLHKFKVNLN
jgi:hypothetical protein